MSRRLRGRAAPTLYHFTAMQHWESIQATGVIRPTVPNLRRPTAAEMLETLAGLPQTEAGSTFVVWLTDDPDPGRAADHGLIDVKRVVRLTVDVPAEPWRTWAARQPGRDLEWLRRVDRTGGGKGSRWFVHVGPIPVGSVTAVMVRESSAGAAFGLR